MNEPNEVLEEIGTQKLVNATPTLVLGITSILPGCICFNGILGIILGIIALAISTKDMRLYEASPTSYSEKDYKNLKAGRICAIIGLSLSALILIAVVSMFVFLGMENFSDPDAIREFFEE